MNDTYRLSIFMLALVALLAMGGTAFAQISDGDANALCTYDSDCEAGQICCLGGGCVAPADCYCSLQDGECILDDDCSDNEYCSENCACVARPDADGDETIDGDADGDSDDNVMLGDCLRDSDCDDNQYCRDDGRCIPLACEDDEDCIFADFTCREADKTCAPKDCVWDTDCLQHELCLQGNCVSDPSTYVEGGVGHCQMQMGQTLGSKWDQLGILIIGLLLLVWLRYIRRDRT